MRDTSKQVHSIINISASDMTKISQIDIKYTIVSNNPTVNERQGDIITFTDEKLWIIHVPL
jgi:hypothetical protein